MKRMILVSLMVAAAVQISSAQPKNTEYAKRAKHETTVDAARNNKAHGHEAGLQMLRHELGLDEEQFKAFAPVYGEYRKALRGDKKPEQPKLDPKQEDDAQVIARLNAWLDREIRIATVRKEYIEKFGTVLSAKQIAKLYRIENSHGSNGGKAPQQMAHRGGANHGSAMHGERGGHRPEGAPKQTPKN